VKEAQLAKAQKWYLIILTGLGVMLSGLVWDAVIHSTEHAHLVVEALFNPADPFENPAHVVIAIGLVWATVATLAAFTMSWLEGKNWRVGRQALSVPIAVWLLMGAGGIVALVTLAQTP
jgi:hypothetical protein